MPPVITVDFINHSTDTGNSQVVLFETSEESTPQNVLSFHNQSGKTQTFVCYQPDGDGVTGTALAWIAVSVATGTEIQIKWRPSFQLVWTEAGSLTPGMHFVASEMVAAMPVTSNRISLGYTDGALHFHDQGPGGEAGTFDIITDSNVPPNTASIGMAMAGKPIRYVQAAPGTTCTFLARPQYWVTTANVISGEVIDLSHLMAEKIQVTFPANVTAMTVTLDADENWNVREGLV
jgi:hypothetical protein